MPRGYYAIISRRGAMCKPGSGNGKPCGGMESARKGAGGEGCARAALPPQGNAARPARQGGARANE